MSVTVGSVLLCFMRQASSRHFKTYLKKRHGTSGKNGRKEEKSVSIQPRFVHLFLIFNAFVSRFVSV